MDSGGYLILALLITCISLHPTDAAARYNRYPGLKSWYDADGDCRSRHGNLPVLDSDDRMRTFGIGADLKPNVSVWTAAYRQHSSWIWVEGCFSAKFVRRSARHIASNQASECASLCQDTTYAALKDKLCYCLDDMRQLSPLDARVCDIPCPGSPHEMCGGEGAVSLYSIGGVNGYKESAVEVPTILEQTIHEASRSDWKNCVYILKHDTPIWITTDCRKSMPFLCKIYRKDGTITEYKSPKGKTGTWATAQAQCREEGGTLADLHANNMEAVSALPDHSEFWVGLYRNTSWTWHAEDTDESPTWCTAVSADRRGHLDFHIVSCSLPLEYLCETGDTGVPAAAAQSTSVTGYVVGGSVAWFLSILAIIGVVFFWKKWKCRRGGASDGTSAIRTNYFDLDEESVTSRQHSYVNDRGPSCSPPSLPTASSSCDQSCEASNLKPGSSQSAGCSKLGSATGNEYASVTPSKGKSSTVQEQHTSLGGACAMTSPQDKSSTSTEGDYDHVWDSLKLERKLQDFAANSPYYNSSENVYTEIGNPNLVQLPDRKDNGGSRSLLKPGLDDTVMTVSMPNGKVPLGRMRSKSL